MKVKVTQVLLDFNGNPIKADKDQNELTLRTVFIDSLVNGPPQEQISGEKKLEQFQLAQRIHQTEEVNFTAEEIILLKKRVALIWGTLVSGLTWQILTGE